MRLINQEFLGGFYPLQFIFACTTGKYCAVALCRNGSKKGPDPTRPNERKKWEVFCNRADKNSRHSAIQESVHCILRKATSRHPFLVEKVHVQTATRLSLTQRNGRIRLVHVRSVLPIGRDSVMNNRKPRKSAPKSSILRTPYRLAWILVLMQLQ